MTYASYTAAVQETLNEVNRSKNLDLELHPVWTYPILEIASIGLGYKLHRKTGQPDRVMSVVVNTFTGFTQANGTITLEEQTKTKIVNAVEIFWGEGETERHTLVQV